MRKVRQKISASRNYLRQKIFKGPPWWTLALRFVGIGALVVVGMGFLPHFSEPRVLTGVEVLRKNKFAQLKGARVALITNHSGKTKKGISTVDLLHEAKGVELVRILSPEHGFRGSADAGEKVQHEIDPKTSLPIYSLYGQTRRPTNEALDGIDVIVYDIQDVGVRFYTYITTMALAMEEAAKRNIRVVILDRPNPIRGDIIEGDILRADMERFTGYHAIPTRYGLTPGELARHFKRTRNLSLALDVIRLENWRRDMFYDETGLPFIPPSPNIRSLDAAILYPGIGCFEATNVSVGRGTASPFELIGAPWLDADGLIARLRTLNFPGVLFQRTTFTPQSSLYKGQKVEGIEFIVTDRKAIRPFDVFLAAFSFIYQNQKDQMAWDWTEIEIVTGSRKLEEALKENREVSDLLSEFDKTSSNFLKTVSQDLLYK